MGALAPDGVVFRLRDGRASRPFPLLLYAEGILLTCATEDTVSRGGSGDRKGESIGGIVEGVLGVCGNEPTHAVSG